MVPVAVAIHVWNSVAGLSVIGRAAPRAPKRAATAGGFGLMAVPVAVQIVGQPPAGMPHGFATACHAAVPVDRFSTPEHANEQSSGYTGFSPY